MGGGQVTEGMMAWMRTSIVCVLFIAHGLSPALCQGTEKLMAVKNTRQLVSKCKGGGFTVNGTLHSLLQGLFG